MTQTKSSVRGRGLKASERDHSEDDIALVKTLATKLPSCIAVFHLDCELISRENHFDKLTL